MSKLIIPGMIRSISLFILLFLAFQSSFPQVSLNSRDVDSSLNVNDFSFVVTGHIYGGGTNLSGYPASTFLGNMDYI